MKLILIRHGETDLNKKGAFQGTSDMVLSDKGREQVQRLGERMFRLAMFHLLDMGNNFYRKFAPSNAGITVFQISKKSGARVVTFNDISHLSGDW